MLIIYFKCIMQRFFLQAICFSCYTFYPVAINGSTKIFYAGTKTCLQHDAHG